MNYSCFQSVSYDIQIKQLYLSGRDLQLSFGISKMSQLFRQIKNRIKNSDNERVGIKISNGTPLVFLIKFVYPNEGEKTIEFFEENNL